MRQAGYEEFVGTVRIEAGIARCMRWVMARLGLSIKLSSALAHHAFSDWYNTVYRHCGIQCVTPQQRLGLRHKPGVFS